MSRKEPARALYLGISTKRLATQTPRKIAAIKKSVNALSELWEPTDDPLALQSIEQVNHRLDRLQDELSEAIEYLNQPIGS